VRAINLLPRDDARRRGPQKTQWIVLVPVVLAVLLAGIFSAMFLSGSGKVKDKQAQLGQLQDELHAIPTPDASKVKTQTALAADKQARVTAITTALSRRVAWDRVFRELSLVLPNDVWLTTVSAKAPVPSATAVVPPPAAPGSQVSATQVTLDGYTYSQPAVARLLSRLQVIPDLVNVQLQQSSSTTVGTAQAVHFIIAADLRRPGGGS
jgi:Tfp pilus assembly protein PilN